MSNVLLRHRGISEMEFYRTADTIRGELTRFLMNDKYVPKKWRFVFTYPTIDLIRQLFSDMIEANDIYPHSDEEVTRRKAVQQRTIDTCEKIYEQLQYMLTTLNYRNIDADNPIAAQLLKVFDLIDLEERLLKAWRRSTKIISG